jgi:hypothetical protein
MTKVREFLQLHPFILPLGFVFLVFSFLVFFVGSGLISQPVRFFTRGAGVESVDPATSLIFATPLSVTNSKTPVDVKVFLRDKNTVAVSGVDVRLVSTSGTIADANEKGAMAVTDKNGLATFSIFLSDLKPATLKALFGPQETPIAKTITIQVLSL